VAFHGGENKYQEIANFVKKIHESSTPIAAICGATMFLAKHGFLDNIKHTGDELDYFLEEMKNEEGYKGQANFVKAQLINDGGFITANETAALEFAREIFLTLKIGTIDATDSWYDKFKYGMIW
jgi:putative intracellular protease/amidase